MEGEGEGEGERERESAYYVTWPTCRFTCILYTVL